MPFVAVFLGVLFSGAISDLLVRRGYSLTFARKAPIVIGLLLKGGDYRLPLVFIAIIEALGVFSYIFVVGKLERVPEQRLSRRLAGMDWAAAPHRGVRYTNADSLTHASYMTRPIRRRGLDAHGGNALAPWV